MPADRRGRGVVGPWGRLVPHDGGGQPRTLPVHVQRDGAELPYRHDILHRELPEPLAMSTLDDWPGPRWAAIAASHGRAGRRGLTSALRAAAAVVVAPARLSRMRQGPELRAARRKGPGNRRPEAWPQPVRRLARERARPLRHGPRRPLARRMAWRHLDGPRARRRGRPRRYLGERPPRHPPGRLALVRSRPPAAGEARRWRRPRPLRGAVVGTERRTARDRAGLQP